jgi:hypothetical protein
VTFLRDKRAEAHRELFSSGIPADGSCRLLPA